MPLLHPRSLLRLPVPMPLRARILNPAFQMSTTAASTTTDDVVFESHLAGRIVKLNRPKKLNALNTSMLDKILPRIIQWNQSEIARFLLIKGEGSRALCAGGDVAAVIQGSTDEGIKFFGDEYFLDYVLATYSKPVITFMNGITMGGGAGLCMHTPFRIATETTIFAMPETLIGFYPDVGALFFLSRLPGQLGTFLAMTGERLTGFDAYFSGVATHLVLASRLPELEARLCELENTGNMLDAPKYAAQINQTINEFQAEVPSEFTPTYTGETRVLIDSCFKFNTFEEIKAALTSASETSEFARKTLDTMSLRCPLSMKVALVGLRKAAKWNIKQALQHDIYAASKFMTEPDFVTGVTYRVIEKKNGRADWQTDMSESEIAEKFFPNSITTDILTPYLDKFQAAEYDAYPYQMGLPSESEVRDYVLGDAKDSGPYLKPKSEIIDHFVQTYDKTGVEAHVAEILDRKTKPVKGHEEESLVNWV
ncbi:ClpP/crotonase-like domain-containing protein [Lipomyces arxii]|uniref:mitochondrial 37S ribosomal protein mS47 n=1 Tax=Lipomyces arxii TaxID=56418 RepID=UPI0034CEFF38